MRFFQGSVLVSSFFLFTLTPSQESIMLKYTPQLNKKFVYELKLKIVQNLERFGTKKPHTLLPSQSEFEAVGKFSLEISSKGKNFVETYTLLEITTTMKALSQEFPIKDLQKYVGKKWEVLVSKKGEVLKQKNFKRFYSEIPYGKKLKKGENFKTKSLVLLPFLDMDIEVQNKMTYTLNNIKENLCFFTFSSEVEAFSSYPEEKEFEAESKITGKGTGSFTYNNSKGIVENAQINFILISDVFSHGKQITPKKLKMKQEISLSAKIVTPHF